MAVSAIDALPGISRKKKATVASETDAQILVLATNRSAAGFVADSARSAQTTDRLGRSNARFIAQTRGVHLTTCCDSPGTEASRHQAWDPRTWLNGLPVTESPLADEICCGSVPWNSGSARDH